MYTIRFHSSISELGPEAWNALARGAGPFLSYAFLHALESSGSVGEGTGWLPQHISVLYADEETSAPALCAVMPMYIKHNSYGEYVFDWAWAEAWHANGVAYYPKLVSAIPFTPSVSPRLLAASGVAEDVLVRAIHQAVTRHGRDIRASSWHVLFPPEDESEQWQAQGMARRTGTQFHWHNRTYAAFDDFLATMSSRKRKVMRKERQAVHDAGIRFRVLSGHTADERDWDRFYRFYQSTYAMRGQQGYLTRAFFRDLSQNMPDAICLIMAEQGGEPVAGALNLVGDDTLYGRYWGAAGDLPFLHFETCFYQGIEQCIERGLKRFDAGAQGEHKIKRGFEPLKTWSAHWVADERFRAAINRFCQEESAHVDRYMTAAAKLLPYKKAGT